VKRLLPATAILVIAVAVFVGLTVSPARITLQNPTPDGSIAGIVHVHSNRSDGQSSVDAIAAAAARAGLRFVVFTDHGDATRLPDAPQYRSGVLCLDGVEISTAGGHYIAIDMPVAPYPLAGEPRDVVDDVRRLGGFGIVAHPDSPKPQLQWHEWDAPFDAVETINLDTGWRQWAQQAIAAAGRAPRWSARGRLFAAIVDYPFRPSETIAGLMQMSGGLAHHTWPYAGRRRVVAIAGADAHAKLEWRGDPAQQAMSLPLPGYESSFRTLSIHVTPERPLSGNAAADAAILMRGIRAGHLYVAIDAVASPAAFTFTASNVHGTVHQGDELGVGGPVTLHVRSNAPAGFTTVVRDGEHLISANQQNELSLIVGDHPAIYWVEITSTGQRTPLSWITGNPIYVRASEWAARPPARAAPVSRQAIFNGESSSGWLTEQDPNSQAALEVPKTVGGAELRLRFALAGGAAAGQFVGLVHPTPDGVAASDRLTFTARAERPMRISVQLRVPGNGPADGQRWQRSIFVDAFDQPHTVYFDDLTRIGTARTVTPPLADVRSILFVIDTINTKPGVAGRLWIKGPALER
jgi:hypothetical protein